MNAGCTTAACQPSEVGGASRVGDNGVPGGAADALKFSCGYEYHWQPELPSGLKTLSASYASHVLPPSVPATEDEKTVW